VRKRKLGRPPVHADVYREPLTVRLPNLLRVAFLERCRKEGKSAGRVIEAMVRVYLRRKER
jgi:hypothetical protein